MKSSEQLMLQAVWRKAWASEDGLELTFRTKSGATRARLQLYNAVRAQKAGTDMEDIELVRAAEGLEIVWAGETKLRMQRRDANDMMQGISAALGGKTVHDFVDPEAAAMAERLMREVGQLAEEPKEEAPEIKHTDTSMFYTPRGR